MNFHNNFPNIGSPLHYKKKDQNNHNIFFWILFDNILCENFQLIFTSEIYL